jgi:gamma-aminobutyric acid type B receptor
VEYEMRVPLCLFQGYVAFSSQGDRIALTQIEQIINGTYVKLGYYDTQSDNLTWLGKEKWSGEF